MSGQGHRKRVRLSSASYDACACRALFAFQGKGRQRVCTKRGSLVGYVGSEVRGDEAYTSFRLATVRRYRDLNGRGRQAATWHTVKRPGAQGAYRSLLPQRGQGWFRLTIVVHFLLRLSSKEALRRRKTLEQLVAALSDDEITVLQEMLRRRLVGE